MHVASGVRGEPERRSRKPLAINVRYECRGMGRPRPTSRKNTNSATALWEGAKKIEVFFASGEARSRLAENVARVGDALSHERSEFRIEELSNIALNWN